MAITINTDDYTEKHGREPQPMHAQTYVFRNLDDTWRMPVTGTWKNAQYLIRQQYKTQFGTNFGTVYLLP